MKKFKINSIILSPKCIEAVKERRQKAYKLILGAFIDFRLEEEKKKQFVDDNDIADIYLTDIYPSDLLQASLDFYHSSLSSQFIGGTLFIKDSQIGFLDELINNLKTLRGELKNVRETGDTESLKEHLLREDTHFKSYLEKYENEED